MSNDPLDGRHTHFGFAASRPLQRSVIEHPLAASAAQGGATD